MSKVASEVVGGVLNELHLAIKKHDIEKAESLFEQAKATFDEMEENQDVLIYFSLLEERYRMMLFDARGSGCRTDLILMIHNPNVLNKQMI